MVTFLAAIAFAQESAPSSYDVEEPAPPAAASWDAGDGAWTFDQQHWMDLAKTHARLSLLLGDASPGWALTLIGKFDKDLARTSVPPLVGPKGKEGRYDGDHDGKPDWMDLCPSVKAKKSDFGCPVVEYGVASGRERQVRVAVEAYAKAMKEAEYSYAADPLREGVVRLDSDLQSYAEGWFPDWYSGKNAPAAPPPPPAIADGDEDGSWDEDDLCPSDAEDKDGFEDQDGCPDVDNDKDGLVDATDSCPNDVEDKDAFQDEDGCPDPDNDGDLVGDASDKCPSQAETPNGFQDEDGCPDQMVASLLDWSTPAPAKAAPAKPAPVQTYTPPVATYSAPVTYTPPVPQPKPLPSVDARLATGKKAKNDVAVVIGLEDYFAIPDVPYAKRDADAFYSFLVYTRGVPQDRIQSLSSGGKEHIAAAVERAGKEVGPGGTVWVYFAGHGAANPKSGERMLLGDDVRSDAIGFASRGIEVSEIERLASANGGTPMLVLDTCYSGAGRNGGTLIAGTRFAVPQYEAARTGSSMQWNAASPDQISGPLDPVQHGAFTYFAVGALRGWADGEIDAVRDGKVTGTEAQAYVRRALRAYQKNDQQPVWVGPNDPVLSEGAAEKGPEF